MTTKIFISYRRNDSKFATTTIYNELCEFFDRENVFMDVDAIRKGQDFRHEIQSAVQQCDILLAVLGDTWLTAKDSKGNGLENPEDFVRIELEAALERKIPLIPLLVDGAKMPETSQLPVSIQEFVFRNAAVVRSGRDFKSDIENLIHDIHQTLGRKMARDEHKVPTTNGSPNEQTQGKGGINPAWIAFAAILVALIVLIWPPGEKTNGDKDEQPIDLPAIITSTAKGLELVKIRAGTFMMGSPNNEMDRSGLETQHRVELTEDYYLGITEVTQGQYQTVLGVNPSEFLNAGPLAPVDGVDWEDAMRFCRILTDLDRNAKVLPKGWAYRLPTEAQWEYACRAGTKGPAYLDRVSAIAWFSENSEGTTHPVRRKLANNWGIYDMLGNVMEWCLDWHGSYPNEPAFDPQGPATGTSRVVRGCDWGSGAEQCRSAFRNGSSPGRRSSRIGFRVAAVRIR